VLGRIVKHREEVVGAKRKQHNEDLHNLYTSPSAVKMVNSRRIG
jgi:hypothetical protein